MEFENSTVVIRHKCYKYGHFRPPIKLGSDAASPQMHIEQITSRGEEHFERYGGDDIHEPPPKEFLVGGTKLEQYS